MSSTHGELVSKAVNDSRKISFENWFPLMEWVRDHQKRGEMIDPDELMVYIRELRDEARKPVLAAVEQLLGKTNSNPDNKEQK